MRQAILFVAMAVLIGAFAEVGCVSGASPYEVFVPPDCSSRITAEGTCMSIPSITACQVITPQPDGHGAAGPSAMNCSDPEVYAPFSLPACCLGGQEVVYVVAPSKDADCTVTIVFDNGAPPATVAMQFSNCLAAPVDFNFGDGGA